MGQERQFKLRTRFIAARGVGEYRQTIPDVVRQTDRVLEIGCEWGATTKVLATYTAAVIGTDVSLKVIERARESHPDIVFEVLDGFDVAAASALGSFDVVYIDMSGLSGYRSLLDVISLLIMYGTVLRPRVIVVKSGALKHFADHCQAWHGREQSSQTDDSPETGGVLE